MKHVIAVDYDGTLHMHKGEVNVELAAYLAELYEDRNNYIVIHTARSYTTFHDVRNWLIKNDIKHHAIVMEKMRADIYIDDRGIHPNQAIDNHRRLV